MDRVCSVNSTSILGSELPEDPSKRNFLKYGIYALLALVGGAVAYYLYPKSRQSPQTGTMTTVTSTSETTPTRTLYQGLRLFFPEMPENEAAAVVEYLQVLDKNSNVLRELRSHLACKDFRPDIEITDDACFLKIKGHSYPGEPDLGLGQLMEKRRKMEAYLFGSKTDTVDIYPRSQIHYVKLRPDRDSDEGGILDRYDSNPRIPEPRPVKSDIHISAYYVPGWSTLPGYRSSDWSLGTNLKPFIGFYDGRDPDVFDWQIKCFVEYGGKSFAILLTHYWAPPERSFEDLLLNSKFSDFINFYSVFGNEYYWNKPSQINSHAKDTMRYICENYFSDNRYLKINGKPLLIFYHVMNLHHNVGEKKLNELVDIIRNVSDSNGYDIYLVGDVMETWHNSHNDRLVKLFDGITSYNILDAGTKWRKNEKGQWWVVAPYDSMVSGYIEECKYWSGLARKYSKGFIPPLCPGFSNRLMYEKGIDNWFAERAGSKPQKFKKMCEGVKPYIDLNINMVLVEAWNEYAENSVIEPTKEFGFDYLNVLRDVFRK